MLDQMSRAWSDPEMLWLNLTNATLGLVCLVCIGAVAFAIAHELIERALAHRETHAFHVAGLGLTMADGGEPVKPDAEKPVDEHR